VGIPRFSFNPIIVRFKQAAVEDFLKVLSSNSINEDDVKEVDFLQELHDRVLDQVTEQLRESGIDLRPGAS
jgi:hypothetical protein